MVLAVALISLVALSTQPEPQAARSDDSLPYTLSGVRRTSNVNARPSAESATIVQIRPGQRLAVESQFLPCTGCDLMVTSGPSWASTAPPTWHDQFLAMTYPDQATPFNSMAGNRDRAMAVATSVGFALAFQGITKLVQKIAGNVRQNKVDKVRSEIDAELAVLEQLNRAARKADPGPVRK